MNQGYDNFFKQAKKVRSQSPLSEIDQHFAADKTKVKYAAKNSSQSSSSDFAADSGHHLSPEQKLKIKFLERKRLLKKQAQRKTRMPIFALGCLLSAIICVCLGYYYSNRVEYLLKHVEVKMSSAIAADSPAATAPAAASSPAANAAKSADPVAANAEKKSPTDATKNKNEVPDLRAMSKEELSYFGHLVDRKKELDQREAELNKLDEELQKQRVELEDKIHKLEKMRSEISGVLKDRVEVDQEKVGKLVQFYSTMKAQQAAKVIESLNEDLAVEVLDKMKKKNAAEIMNSLDPKKAKKLSEMLAGYRKPASDEESKR